MFTVKPGVKADGNPKARLRLNCPVATIVNFFQWLDARMGDGYSLIVAP